MSKQIIGVVSTFSTDKLVNEQGEVLAVRPGGPAMFIERAVISANIPYKLTSGEPVDVEILITPEGEFGRITNVPRRQRFAVRELPDWVIVSTILDEWQFAETLPTRLFVDIQGYVRDGKDFGKKQSSRVINDAAGTVFCLKGTKEEIGYLTQEALERQKQQLLLVTDGGRGVDLYYQGQYTYLPIHRIKGLPDTIGAGDSFFAYFVAAMFKGNEPVVAAQYAIKQTSQFLKAKLTKEYVL